MLPFVQTEGEPYARERALIRPAIEAARADLPNYAFHQKHFKKMLIEMKPDAQLGPEYAALAKDKARFSKVAKALGVRAVLAHPWPYTQLVGQ